MKELFEFLSQHIFTVHLEMGFVPTQQEAPAPDNLVDLRAYNELQHEVPNYYDPEEDEDRLAAKFGFK